MRVLKGSQSPEIFVQYNIFFCLLSLPLNLYAVIVTSLYSIVKCWCWVVVLIVPVKIANVSEMKWKRKNETEKRLLIIKLNHLIYALVMSTGWLGCMLANTTNFIFSSRFVFNFLCRSFFEPASTIHPSVRLFIHSCIHSFSFCSRFRANPKLFAENLWTSIFKRFELFYYSGFWPRHDTPVVSIFVPVYFDVVFLPCAHALPDTINYFTLNRTQ